jgi:quinol monooxygenase YgiN
MSRFSQHTKLRAAPGKTAALAAKFLEAVEIQRDNPSCELMIVSTSPTDDSMVFLTEIWSSEVAWDLARQSAEITAWASDMPLLVDGPPESENLQVLGGKGLSEHSPT